MTTCSSGPRSTAACSVPAHRASPSSARWPRGAVQVDLDQQRDAPRPARARRAPAVCRNAAGRRGSRPTPAVHHARSSRRSRRCRRSGSRARRLLPPGGPGGGRDAEEQVGQPCAESRDDAGLADAGGARQDDQPAPAGSEGAAQDAHPLWLPAGRLTPRSRPEAPCAGGRRGRADDAKGAISSRSMIWAARTFPTPGIASSSAETFILPNTSSESDCFSTSVMLTPPRSKTLLQLSPDPARLGGLRQRSGTLFLGQLGKGHGLLRLSSRTPFGDASSPPRG